jgi:hypothetical protein
LCAAAFDGLIIGLLNTGDLRRTTRALDAFIGTLVHEYERKGLLSTKKRARKARN